MFVFFLASFVFTIASSYKFCLNWYFQENVAGFEECTEVRGGKVDGLGFVDVENDCTELKKRGLCLVPLSVLVNHLG